MFVTDEAFLYFIADWIRLQVSTAAKACSGDLVSSVAAGGGQVRKETLYTVKL